MIEYKNILDVGPEIQETVRRWRNSPRVRDGALEQDEILPEQHARWLKSLEGNPRRIVRVAFCDDRPFGISNLMHIDRRVSSSAWGIYIGDENFLGRRLGQRLIFDSLEWGFMEEGLNKIYAEVRSDNKILYSDLMAGNHIEGFLKDHTLDARGNLIGVTLIAQFRADWLKNREKLASWSKIGD